MAKSYSAQKQSVKMTIKKAAKLVAGTPLVKKAANKSPYLKHKVKKVAKRLLQTSSEEELRVNAISDTFDDYLAGNYDEHAKLLDANKAYWYERESPSFYTRSANDPRMVAIYLPQFHPFKENDEAWGKGFTEWTNVTSSFARYAGQQQPVLPSDLGFYDLRLPEIMKQQIDLAKKYGLYGFQFYYYWFSGKKVMELPINTILNNKDWDFNFSICWANENWTRKWDGGSSEVIFEQKNLPDDPIKFIEDVSQILLDDRYICEDGKPILTVYRVELLDDPQKYVDTWRKYFRDNFKKELWLVGHCYDAEVDPKDFGFDATMDFTPIASLQPTLKPWVDDRKYLTQDIFENHKLLDKNWRGNVIDFRFIAKQEIANLKNNKHYYKTISPSWSNEARRKGNDGYTFANSSPEIFYNWLDSIVEYELAQEKKQSPIVFINAWNEWAEAAMIEPSQHMGHSSLKRIAEVTSKYGANKENQINFSPYDIKFAKKSKLAVVVHLYYSDMWSDIAAALAKIDVNFDLYISTPEENKDLSIDRVSDHHINTNITVVPNRGRDVLPFLMITNRIRAVKNYSYILKLHTKKSKHRNDGNIWFNDVLRQLIPDNGVGDIVKVLSKESNGIVGPRNHIVSLSRHMGGNRLYVEKLVESMTEAPYTDTIDDESKYPFFGSTMFWCRVDTLDPLLDLYLQPSDFDSEKGQIDGTIAHGIERVMGGLLHTIVGKKMFYIKKDGKISEINSKSRFDSKYKFAD